MGMKLVSLLSKTSFKDMKNKYSILVNTSDSFEDCWMPFFTLFEKYWPESNAPIYLNTEKKIWKHPRLDIRSTAVQGNSESRLTWSECLLAALDQIETPFILYFQDYFIHQKVNNDVIASAIEYMVSHPEVKHISLTRHGSIGPHEPYEVDWLAKIHQKAKYRISTQAGLWSVDTLKSYLRAEENGWMFEIYGTWRARRRPDCFLCVTYEANTNGPPIDYLHTGIIKGKWLQEIQQVFETNEITVDYSKRGFYFPKQPALRKLEVGLRLIERPIYLLRQLF
jgi:hypothetical protein